MPEPAIERLTDFIYEMGLLKRYRRAGWPVAGVGEAESIAEHAFRTAIIGYLLALLEGADSARTALLCLFHDSQETRVGDVPLIGRRYVTTAANPEVTADQVAGFPAEIGRAVRDLVDEYEADASPEARLARDADKLECLVQAREYQEAHGNQDLRLWVESSAAALRSRSALELAEACRRVPPRRWWQALGEATLRHDAPARPDG
jgi:putative hydrolases of HD superfamily